MLNLSDLNGIFESRSDEALSSTEKDNRFPTTGLRSLLQNSELLELLLKPLESETVEAEKSTVTLGGKESNKSENDLLSLLQPLPNDLSDFSAPDSLLKSKPLFDLDNLDEYFESKSIYL